MGLLPEKRKYDFNFFLRGISWNRSLFVFTLSAFFSFKKTPQKSAKTCSKSYSF